MTDPVVAVGVPTMRRPDGLARAVRSVIQQTGLPGGFEILVIENDPAGSALAVIDTLKAEAEAAGVTLRAAHEPRPGVAHARNALLQLATAPVVAWLDDDQEAPPGWLAAMLATHTATGADATFGPVQARAPDNAGAGAGYLEHVYTRTGPTASGVIPRAYGMGNSMTTRATMFPDDPPFALDTNEQGGEDDTLFAAAAAAGRRFAWAAEAGVVEHITAKCSTLAFALRRAFAYGQGPCETAARAKPPRVFAIAAHMATGALQTLVFSPIAAAAFLARAPYRYWLMDKAARGAGKLIWWKPQRFYGAALIRQDETQAPG